jgi:hypothetical protein
MIIDDQCRVALGGSHTAADLLAMQDQRFRRPQQDNRTDRGHIRAFVNP